MPLEPHWIEEFIRFGTGLDANIDDIFFLANHSRFHQVSHGPDISAFYGSNRAEGFVVNGSITFRDK